MLLLLIFIMIVGPICTLLHELGHGLGAISTSKSSVHIYLGKKTESNKENFRLGRLHFHIQWSFAVGFTQWGAGLDRRQKAVALAGGPVMSLLLIFLFGFLASVVPQNELRQLFYWTTTFNLIQFVVAMLPINYPKWLIGRSDMPSDGLQLLRLLREDIKAG